MEFTLTYVRYFYLHVMAMWPLLAMLSGLVLLLGLLVGKIESWPKLDAAYWAFITATTVGYGDIRPKRGLSRLLAVLIAFVGVTFTRLLVALAINAATLAFAAVESAGS